jgi:hypothetical protein
MNKNYFPIDTNDPMNGIITYMKSNNVLNNYVSIYASAISSGTNRATVDTLFARNVNVYFQLGNNKIGEYFEIRLLNGSFITLTGYGFMSTTKNYFKPRNWNVSCVSTIPPTLLANEVNNDTLCKGYESDYCPTNDKKAFYSTQHVECSNIRFTVTGYVSGASSYNIALAGVELFGWFNERKSKRIAETCFITKPMSFPFIYIVLLVS